MPDPAGRFGAPGSGRQWNPVLAAMGARSRPGVRRRPAGTASGAAGDPERRSATGSAAGGRRCPVGRQPGGARRQAEEPCAPGAPRAPARCANRRRSLRCVPPPPRIGASLFPRRGVGATMSASPVAECAFASGRICMSAIAAATTSLPASRSMFSGGNSTTPDARKTAPSANGLMRPAWPTGFACRLRSGPWRRRNVAVDRNALTGFPACPAVIRSGQGRDRVLARIRRHARSEHDTSSQPRPN